MSNDDVWLNAIAAFPDVGPFVKLLRSDVPMPPGARDLLAEMLAPGKPPIDGWQLQPVPNPDWDKTLEKFSIETRYHQNQAAGMKSEQAAQNVGDQEVGVRQVGVRQVHRIVAEKTAERLHKRLKGQDE